MYILPYAFDNCTSLTKLTIGKNVRAIGKGAFRGCTALEELYYNAVSAEDFGSSNEIFKGCATAGMKVVFGKDVMRIPSYFFYPAGSGNSPVVLSVDFEDGCTLTEIGAHAFYYLNKIESLELPKTVTVIGNNALMYLSSLKSLVIPSGVTEIQKGMLKGCYALESLTIPFIGASLDMVDNGNIVFGYIFGDYVSNSLLYSANQKGYDNYNGTNYGIPLTLTTVNVMGGNIGYGAFMNMTSLTTVNLAEGVTGLGKMAFYNCKSLSSVNFPSTINTVGENAFYYSALVEVIIPDNITSIGADAFYHCHSLQKVVIGDGVIRIGSRAFSSCTALTELSVGKSVVEISNNAFAYASSLTKLYFNAANLAYFNEYGGKEDGDDVFRNAGVDGTGIEVVFGKDLQHVPIYMFYPYYAGGTPKIVSVEFEEGSVCRSIGQYAFYKCTEFTTINIPNTVTHIGLSAFNGCKGLTEIVIPDSVIDIGTSAFAGCSSVKSLTIGEGYAYSGNTVFSGLRALEVIRYNAIRLADFSNSTNSLMFSDAGIDGNGIVLIIGNKVTAIPTALFSPNLSSNSYPKITEVVFEDGSVCTTIGVSAFRGCIALKKVVLPDSVTEIGNYAFKDCSSLTTLVFPTSITTMGENIPYYEAFSGCYKIVVYYRGNAEQWEAVTGRINLSTVRYYSEQAPNQNDMYWHYDENGNVVVWEV